MSSLRAGSETKRSDQSTSPLLAAPDMVLLASVERTRTTLQQLVWMRAALLAFAAGLVTWLVLLAASRQVPVSPVVMIVAALFIMPAVLVAQLLRRAGVTSVRAALWLEEQRPAGYTLVTLVEEATAPSGANRVPMSRVVRSRLAGAYFASVGGAPHAREIATGALKRLAIARLRDPLIFTLAATALLVWFHTLGDSSDGAYATSTMAGARGAPTSARANAPIGKWLVRVQPPAYAQLPTQQMGDADGVKVLSASKVTIEGNGDVPSSIALRTLLDSAMTARAGLGGASTLNPSSSSNGWSATLTTTAAPTELRVMRGRASRLLLIEGYDDSIPRVSLRTPARDSVLRSATGKLLLEATLHDDLGLANAAFEMIISSGEGERFTARTVRVGAHRYADARNVTHGVIHDATLRTALDLDSMKLGPGDIVHLRAVARDAYPAVTREWGSSETRSIRIARPAEYDSVAVDAAPPPEVDKSLLSQRMLLLLTEKLEARRARLTTIVLADETSKLARDQTRLRLAVGDAVFQRLGNESSAEHAEGDERGIKLVDGKLVMPPNVTAAAVLEEGDDSPVIGINKPLLEAYNAMWDAGRALELGDRRGAIPHMRIALAAIERARAASRLYLRGKPPIVILDLAKIRLAGKDTGTTNLRSRRVVQSFRLRDREARLLRAATLATTDASSARDSIAVLRLEVVGDAPDFAAALELLGDALNRGGEVTVAFARARRTLGGMTRASTTDWSRVGPP